MLAQEGLSDVALYLDEFQGCCGIRVCYNLGYETEKPFPTSRIIDGAQRESLRVSLKAKTQDTAHVGMCLIALNSIQESWGLEEIVLECGYRKLTEEPFFHPGHGRYITLYGFEHHPHRRQSKATPPPTPRSAPVQFFSNSRAKW